MIQSFFNYKNKGIIATTLQMCIKNKIVRHMIGIQKLVMGCFNIILEAKYGIVY